MSDQELNMIIGGAGISGSIINAISRLLNTLYDLGRAVGSVIRRGRKGITC